MAVSMEELGSKQLTGKSQRRRYQEYVDPKSLPYMKAVGPSLVKKKVPGTIL